MPLICVSVCVLCGCVCIDGDRQRRWPNRRLPVRRSPPNGAHLKTGLCQAPRTRREKGQQTPHQGCRGEWGRKLDIILMHKIFYTSTQPNQHNMYELTCHLMFSFLPFLLFTCRHGCHTKNRTKQIKQNSMFSSVERCEMDYCWQLKSNWAD